MHGVLGSSARSSSVEDISRRNLEHLLLVNNGGRPHSGYNLVVHDYAPAICSPIVSNKR